MADAMATENAERPNDGWDGHFRNSDGGAESGHMDVADADIINIRNVGKIKFDPPKVPVIFVLGGPGSGKVTHCDTFMQERRGVTHINMMDLLQQYAMGNAMHDFAQLPSKTVTEVLMLEMKMAPAAKIYLISGYPRSMRDVVEYSEKIQIINGVVLISWRESVLQKQIDYGAKLGHVVLSLAKMELENFFKNVIPVADYFDQSGLLIAVNGERAPAEVYKDFRSAVLDILMSLENQEAILNGVTGMGRGINDIPGSIVSVETVPSQERNITDISNHPTNDVDAYQTNTKLDKYDMLVPKMDNVIGNAIASNHNPQVNQKLPALANASTSMTPDVNRVPPMIWVIGGPGSNKAALCIKAISLLSNWAHFSVGRLLRSLTESNPRINTENYVIKEALSAGELVPEKIINNVIDSNLRQFANKSGVIIDGYPRNMDQVKFFENKYKQQPYMVLLDCSKLQLGRGRIDDTVSSFRRRLELFREQTLPMLRFMDASNRLQIIDGDTDSPTVQREFEKCLRNFVDKLNIKPLASQTISTVAVPLLKANNQTDAILQDLEGNTANVVPTISHQVSLLNDNHAKKETLNRQMNGDIATGRNMDFRHMLEEAERYPVDSYM